MSLLKILTESSSLQVPEIKKAMMKDESVSILFSKELKIESIPDKNSFLSSVKYWIFNNQNVKEFIASRNNIRDLDVATFDFLRKLRIDDLNQRNLDSIKEFISHLFKEFTFVENSKLSPEIRKIIADWLDTSGGYRSLPSWAERELMSVPGLRPTKRILIYRGLLFSENSFLNKEKYDGTVEPGNGLKFIRAIKKGSKEVNLEWNFPSSWSKSREIATRFAKYGPASSSYTATLQWLEREMRQKQIDGALGFVISTFANPEDILLDTQLLPYYLGSKHSDEQEVILKPGKYKAIIVKKFTAESGEVSPVETSPENNSEFLKVIQSAEKLDIESILPENYNGMIYERHIYNSMDLLSDKKKFKNLILNSTTTHLIHALEKLKTFYEDDLKKSSEFIKPEKFSHDAVLHSKSELIGKIKKILEQQISSKRIKLIDVSAEDFRKAINSPDIIAFENNLMRYGRMTDSTAGNSLQVLATHLSVTLPSSAKIHMFGSAKQQPIFAEVINSFFSSLSIDKPDSESEAKKEMINFIKKAYRNYAVLRIILEINELLGDIQNA